MTTLKIPVRPALNRDEAAAVLRALDAIATADNKLIDDERKFLFSFAERHGLPISDVQPATLDTQAIARALPSADKRKELIRLCLEMAHVDRSYPPRENLLVVDLARALDISDHDLADLTDEVRGDDMPEEEW